MITLWVTCERYDHQIIIPISSLTDPCIYAIAALASITTEMELLLRLRSKEGGFNDELGPPPHNHKHVCMCECVYVCMCDVHVYIYGGMRQMLICIIYSLLSPREGGDYAQCLSLTTPD